MYKDRGSHVIYTMAYLEGRGVLAVGFWFLDLLHIAMDLSLFIVSILSFPGSEAGLRFPIRILFTKISSHSLICQPRDGAA